MQGQRLHRGVVLLVLVVGTELAAYGALGAAWGPGRVPRATFAQAAPAGLLTQLRSSPVLGVETPTPRLTWVVPYVANCAAAPVDQLQVCPPPGLCHRRAAL